MPSNESHPRRVTLRDIAAEAGVSYVTVSLALRNDPRISEERRRTIHALAERLGYRPDPMLAALSSYRHARRSASFRSTIAWINQWEKPARLRKLQEFDAYWRGAVESAERLGYHIEEFIVGGDLTSARLHQILETRTVRGVLIPPHQKALHLPDFDWSQFSIVRFGISVPQPRAHIVTSDQKGCAETAFERMWSKGYRRIGYVSSRDFDSNTGGNFRAGYLSSQDAHVPLRQHLVPLFLGEDPAKEDPANLTQWLRKSRPDAVISSVRHLRKTIESVGVQVPRDLAVAALSLLDGQFDAGMNQNSAEIGRVAMATLAALINQNERGIPAYCRRILVEGLWVDGQSVPERGVPGPV